MTQHLERRPDWRARLLAYGRAAARERFAYGVHDCALFAARAVQAMTGDDLHFAWAGRYTSRRGGLRVLRAAGFDDHVALVASLLPECPVLRARVGDVAVVEGDDGAALGIVIGEAIWVLRPEGLGSVPLSSASRAFRV
jgi:hypothetical protein